MFQALDQSILKQMSCIYSRFSDLQSPPPTQVLIPFYYECNAFLQHAKKVVKKTIIHFFK